MITGELKSKIDRVWDAFWSGGISNPLEVIEQITYLMFIRRLEDIQTVKERRANRTGKPVENPIYTEDTQVLRWSRFTNEAPQNMFTIVRDGVFPWLRTLGGKDSTYSHHMKDARFTITTPNLLAKVVDMLDDIPLDERDTKGDLYEYMLSKIATAGQNGQFRTPRHVIQLIVEMMAPRPEDEICDPACGTAGFLVACAEYVNRTHREALLDPAQRKHFNESMFHGFDFDSTMLRIGSMNMLLHGVENPDIRYRDSLAQSAAGEAERYSLILANPPFAGSLDYEVTAKDLQALVKTKKTELLFLALFLRLLKAGGRAAVIVPDGVLFGSSKAHKDLRRLLVEDHKLDAVVKLPGGVFKPYAGVSTAILFFTKTNSGGTDNVWFYEVRADGWSLDDKRTPLLPEDKLGPIPSDSLTEADHAKNNLPDVLVRWNRRNGTEQQGARTEQSFCVPKADIAAQGYDLSLNRYKVGHEVNEMMDSEGWRLRDIAEVLAGWVAAKEIDKTSNPTGVSNKQRVLHPSLLTSSLPEVSELPISMNLKEPSYRLREGDIVGRDLARERHWTVLPSGYDGVQAGQGLLIIRLTGNVIPAEYLAAYLSSPYAESRFIRYGVIPRIRPRDLPEILIPACSGNFEEIRMAINKLKEGIEEADRIRRKLQQSRMSIFESWTSDERRSRLEQAADLSSLIAQNLRKQSEPYQIFQETYPYAIARAVRKFKHSATLPEKHEAAIQCIESLILSLGIVSLAFVAHWGQKTLVEITKWRESVGRGGVSLGHWVGVIRAAGASARESGDEAAGLAEATAPKKGGKGLVADLGDLVNLRNKVRHGAGPRTRAELERSLQHLEVLMVRSLSSSTFLAKTQWIHMDRLRWLPSIGKYQLSGLAIMGDHPDFEPVERTTSHPLADDSLYMLTQQGEIYPLSPFCILGDCPTCLTPELYYPDRLTTTTALLKSLDRGHELESSAVFNALHLWIDS